MASLLSYGVCWKNQAFPPTISAGLPAAEYSFERENGTNDDRNLVPGTGVEPAHLAVLDPKSSASANSAIRALAHFNPAVLKKNIGLVPKRSIPAALDSWPTLRQATGIELTKQIEKTTGISRRVTARWDSSSVLSIDNRVGRNRLVADYASTTDGAISVAEPGNTLPPYPDGLLAFRELSL